MASQQQTAEPNLTGVWPHLTQDERQYILKWVNIKRFQRGRPETTMAELPFITLGEVIDAGFSQFQRDEFMQPFSRIARKLLTTEEYKL